MIQYRQVVAVAAVVLWCAGGPEGTAADLTLQLRRQIPASSGGFVRTTRDVVWPAASTAIIVCDVWDKHHCLNAVRRMEEFLPRLNEVLTEARRRGVTIIHAPSDCMPAYENHPARLRAMAAPEAAGLPAEAPFWCSQIPAEESAVYPIDQSDGGEDDAPDEHARWAAELQALGRNPAMPWKAQHPALTIDPDADFISDRGEEVWNILEARGVRHVILAGVHTNMCVLGRPFGLRQMVRQGRDVVLMRDLTDSMYNPKRWPYTDHFTGHDLVVSHVERYVCPTITSDQIVGGRPFVWAADQRPERDVVELPPSATLLTDGSEHWRPIRLPQPSPDAFRVERNASEALWLRCSVRVPSDWTACGPLALRLPSGHNAGTVSAWINGTPLNDHEFETRHSWTIPAAAWRSDDINLLVLRCTGESSTVLQLVPEVCGAGSRVLRLSGRWQLRVGNDESWSNIPLPAKFGMGPDVLFQPPDDAASGAG